MCEGCHEDRKGGRSTKVDTKVPVVLSDEEGTSLCNLMKATFRYASIGSMVNYII
jgi:hypothetical protein